MYEASSKAMHNFLCCNVQQMKIMESILETKNHAKNL